MGPLNIRLVVAGGANEGDVVPVRCSQFLIGRRPGCHFRPAGVADLQCAVVARSGRFFVQNFHHEGTLVGRRQVLGELELRDGDRLQVGEWQLRVRISSKSAVQLARPAIGEDELPACGAPVSVEPPASSDAQSETAAEVPMVPMPAPCPVSPSRAAIPSDPPPFSPSPARRPSARSILVGPKDRAAVLLRQQEWEDMQAKKKPSAPDLPRPRAKRRWLPLAAGIGLVALLGGGFHLMRATPDRPAAISQEGLAENPPRPLPGPRPPRRRALSQAETRLPVGEQLP